MKLLIFKTKILHCFIHFSSKTFVLSFSSVYKKAHYAYQSAVRTNKLVTYKNIFTLRVSVNLTLNKNNQWIYRERY